MNEGTTRRPTGDMGKEKWVSGFDAVSFTGTGDLQDKAGKWFGSGNGEQEERPPGSRVLRNEE